MFNTSVRFNRSDWIDATALSVIGIYALGCAWLGSDFSEIHLSLSFLNFPIFLGELLIAFCLLCLYLKHIDQPIIWKHWQRNLWIFLIFIAGYALWDFVGYKGEPLAFRNAAMYYYVIFLLFGYVFYNPRYFTVIGPFVIPVLIYLMSFIFDPTYFWITEFVVFIFAVWYIRSRTLQLLIIGVFLCTCNYHSFFAGSRTNLISALVVAIFLVFIYLKHFLLLTKTKKIFIAFGMIGVIVLGIFVFADRNGIKSLLKIDDLVAIYQENAMIIDRSRNMFTREELKPELYHDNKEELVVNHQKAVLVDEVINAQNQRKEDIAFQKENIFFQQEELSPIMANGSSSKVVKKSVPAPRVIDEYVDKAVVPKKEDSSLSWVEQMAQQPARRSLSNAQNNAIFRVFIWKDMWDEFIHSPFLLGVGFGKAQRSLSLEILGWGQEEWRRDGWITPHNSYFHVIYRLGIIGIILIMVLFISLIHIYRQFIIARSFKGILMVSVLMYWLTACNFLVILEFPHYGIIFWFMWGTALAFSQQLKKDKNV